MRRQAIRGAVLLGLLTAVALSTARAQGPVDQVTVRDRKDGSTKVLSGTYTVGKDGFQVVGADKKAVTINPDDVVKIAIGELPGIDRNIILGIMAKEDKKDYKTAYEDAKKALAGAAAAPERTKRYLTFRMIANNNHIVDELDADKGWKEKAEEISKDWRQFLQDYPVGWETWAAAKARTRVLVELGKFDEAAGTWTKLAASKDLPPDARLDAALQEIDLNIRAKVYAPAAVAAAELGKTAAGPRKERLAIYEIATKGAAGDKAALDAVTQIKAEMDKTKDPAVHATGFSMMAELYLLANKPRDAMWAFLWVETVLNQDRDEAFKAVVQLANLFETKLMDEEQARKYRDKLKRLRLTF